LIIATIMIAAVIVAQLGLWAYEKWSWRKQPDYGLFLRTCGKCHNAGLAAETAQSRTGWLETTEYMVKKMADQPMSVPSKTISSRIGSLLGETRSADGDELFFWRCGRCHSRKAIDDYLTLAPAPLRLLVQQHVKQVNHVVQKWEGDEIAEAIVSRRPDESGRSSRSSEADQLLFQQRCGECHTPRFVYRTMCITTNNQLSWPTLVERMRQKSPMFIESAETGRLAAHSELICESKQVAP